MSRDHRISRLSMMLREAIGFKRKLDFESKINSNDTTYFQCTTHLYAAPLPSMESATIC